MGKLAGHCEKAGIAYAVLGGAACVALGSTRATEDVDLVLRSNKGEDIDKALQTLAKTDAGFKIGHGSFGEPTFTLDGTEIEAFDPKSWPNRPQYTEFLTPNGHVVQNVGGGAHVSVVAPPLLLREKLVTHEERKGAKSVSDSFDIGFLLGYCQSHKLKLDIKDSSNTSKSARAGLERYLEGKGANKAAAAAVVITK